ncbi:MAG: hypothetical protein M1834_005664 [Cirrosporium novae-zelandiae]|nr:MAG: hypothetical protein M1834_005664 [Cirrosporium novae-zelandiae]
MSSPSNLRKQGFKTTQTSAPNQLPQAQSYLPNVSLPNVSLPNVSRAAPIGDVLAAPPPPSNPRKRRASGNPNLAQPLPGAYPPLRPAGSIGGGMEVGPVAEVPPTTPVAKKSRTNTPWTPAEEQRLKTMRDAGNSWSEIAKVSTPELTAFPARTEGSVKKHWYKDMHYAEFGEDEHKALQDAIREYETNKWKVIGQKVGKPAKACEQYAKEHNMLTN